MSVECGELRDCCVVSTIQYTHHYIQNGPISKAVIFTAQRYCVSAVFAIGRCPSVRLSFTFVYCIKTVEDIVKLLSRSRSPIILVF